LSVDCRSYACGQDASNAGIFNKGTTIHGVHSGSLG
jgi:hypothetical protein